MGYNSSMTKKIIVGNWKMNPVTLKDVRATFAGIKRSASKVRGASVLICPPFIYLPELKKMSMASKVDIGSQDVSAKDMGAETGSVSAYMVRDLGIKTTIVGHSERRALGDTDEIVNQKVLNALTAGLKVILCIGEKVRGDDYLSVLQGQLEKNLAYFPSKLADRLIIAYEPVWAIGTGLAENPEQAEKTMEFISKILTSDFGFSVSDFKIIYGGSVDSNNIAGFLSKKIIQGALVGGASLKKEEFAKILEVADSF